MTKVTSFCKSISIKSLLSYWYSSTDRTLDGRICYFDNIRFVLIYLVVLGHYVEFADTFDELWYFIYFFHMPAFVFTSGYFVKRGKENQRLLNLFSVYLICFVIYFLICTMALGKDYKFTILNPNSLTGLWYLLALCLWNLIAPFFLQMKPVFAISLAFLIGLLVGLDDSIGAFLTLSRVFVFLPFYLLGYYAHQYKWLEKSKVFRFTPIIAVCVVGGLMMLLWNNEISISGSVLTAKRSYSKMEMTAIEGLMERGRYYVLATGMSWAFFMLVPQCKLFFTRLGRNTMSVYFLHLLVLRFLDTKGILVVMVERYSRYSIIVLALILTFVFAQPCFEKPFNWILKAKFSWLKENNGK